MAVASPPETRAEPERSLAEILRELNRSSRKLIRQEFRLARADFLESVAKARRAAIFAGVGVSLAVIALVCLALAATYGLGLLIAQWLAALCVAAGLGLIALPLLRASLRQLEGIDMNETLESLADDREFAERELEMLREEVTS